ncbi:MAG: prolipoprotein diacylglyceryl transferase [Planctomycetes bacterium]|nr:prolipoprotein diacylglyceryl transferase [Planctomycetota bacterium]
MHPILFEIPGLGWPIRSFGVMVAIGFLVGSHIFTRLAARYGDDPVNDPARVSNITVWIVAGVMLGARLMYVIVQIAMDTPDGQHFRADPMSIFFIWQGGLVMYGGMIGAIGFGMWAAKRLKVRPVHALDMGIVAGFVGQAIGRVGCLLVGDDYGKVVPERWQSLPFPITLRVPDPLPHESLFGAENMGKVLWATQPLMTIKALIIAYVGWQILKRRRYTGQVSLWVILLYAILRSLVELLRGDGVRGVWFGNTVSTSQLVSGVMALIAVALLIKNRNKSDPLPDARAQAR